MQNAQCKFCNTNCAMKIMKWKFGNANCEMQIIHCQFCDVKLYNKIAQRKFWNIQIQNKKFMQTGWLSVSTSKNFSGLNEPQSQIKHIPQSWFNKKEPKQKESNQTIYIHSKSIYYKTVTSENLDTTSVLTSFAQSCHWDSDIFCIFLGLVMETQKQTCK